MIECSFVSLCFAGLSSLSKPVLQNSRILADAVDDAGVIAFPWDAGDACSGGIGGTRFSPSPKLLMVSS